MTDIKRGTLIVRVQDGRDTISTVSSHRFMQVMRSHFGMSQTASLREGIKKYRELYPSYTVTTEIYQGV